MATKKWGETIVDKKYQMTLYAPRAKNFVEITVSCTVFKINMLLCFMPNSRCQQEKKKKKKGKHFLAKKVTDDCVYPGYQKFHQNRTILKDFRDKCLFEFYTES